MKTEKQVWNRIKKLDDGVANGELNLSVVNNLKLSLVWVLDGAEEPKKKEPEKTEEKKPEETEEKEPEETEE